MVFGLFSKRQPNGIQIIQEAENNLINIYEIRSPDMGLRVRLRFGMSCAVCGIITSISEGTDVGNYKDINSMIEKIHIDFVESTKNEGSVKYEEVFSNNLEIKFIDFDRKVFRSFHHYGPQSLHFTVSFSQAYEELMSAFYLEAARAVAKQSMEPTARAASLITQLVLGSDEALFNKGQKAIPIYYTAQEEISRLAKRLIEI